MRERIRVVRPWAGPRIYLPKHPRIKRDAIRLAGLMLARKGENLGRVGNEQAEKEQGL